MEGCHGSTSVLYCCCLCLDRQAKCGPYSTRKARRSRRGFPHQASCCGVLVLSPPHISFLSFCPTLALLFCTQPTTSSQAEAVAQEMPVRTDHLLHTTPKNADAVNASLAAACRGLRFSLAEIWKKESEAESNDEVRFSFVWKYITPHMEDGGNPLGLQEGEEAATTTTNWTSQDEAHKLSPQVCMCTALRDHQAAAQSWKLLDAIFDA